MALQQPVEGTIEENDPIPSVFDFLNKTIVSVKEFSSFTKYPTDYAFMRGLLLGVSVWDIFIMLLIAIAFTSARYALDRFLIKPFSNWLQLLSKDKSKFSESLWKGSVYGIMWSYCLYHIILSNKYNFYQYSCRLWNNFNFGDDYFNRRIIPLEFRILYWTQIGFYIHSIYATLYMDAWRKDSKTMLLHHVLAIGMLLVSFAARYYEFGSLLLLLHDINDVILEFTKLNVYLKQRGGKFHKVNDYIGTGGFLLFTACWVYTRLYLFPMKVLHGTNWCAYIYHINKQPNLWLVLNIMLWPLFFMHIYWFGFIVQLIYRVLTGHMSQLDDNRDIDIDANNRDNKESPYSTSQTTTNGRYKKE